MNAPASPAAVAVAAPRPTPAWRSQLGTYLGLMAVLAGMVALFSTLSDYFWSVETFVTIANEIPALAVMAVGMTFVLIIAGIDLSVGSVMALAAAPRPQPSCSGNGACLPPRCWRWPRA